MYLMSKHLESDVKNKKKKSFGKASFCVHVTRTIVKDVPFFLVRLFLPVLLRLT